MRNLLTSTLFLLVGGSALAQQTIYEETRVPFRRELLGGIVIQGDGWGLNFYHGKYHTAVDRRMIARQRSNCHCSPKHRP